MTFLLTSGGHNAGIISEPGHPGRHFRVAEKHEGEPYVGPQQWFDTMPVNEGSWWLTWQRWLVAHSGKQGEIPGVGNIKAGYAPLGDAPGTYVLQK